MGKSSKKKEKSDRINVLRKQYDAFIEEDKKRKERNEYILGRLDKMRNVSLALRNRFNVISSNPLPKMIKYRDENSNHNQLLPQLTSVTSVIQERYIPSVISKDVDHNFVLKEISKKYILIPKINTLSIENIECVDTNKNTDDADWTSKYNILNQLKKCEKENVECIDTNKTHTKKDSFEKNSNDDDKDIDTSQHKGIVNNTDEDISYNEPGVAPVHKKELTLNKETIKHDIDNKLKDTKLEQNIRIKTKALTDNNSDDKCSDGYGVVTINNLKNVNDSKDLRREDNFVNNFPLQKNQHEIQEGQRINSIAQDVNKDVLDTNESKLYSYNEMESHRVTDVTHDTGTENNTKLNDVALLVNNNVQENLVNMLNDEEIKSDDTLKDKEVVDENGDYAHNQLQPTQQEYTTCDGINKDPSSSIADYESQDNYSVENTYQPSFVEEVHSELEPSAMFAKNIEQYNVTEQPVVNEQAGSYANYEQIQPVTTDYIEQPEMYALNTNQQQEFYQYETPAYAEQSESNVQNPEQHDESNSQATEFTGQPENYAVDTVQYDVMDQYGTSSYTDQPETYMNNTEVELEQEEKTEFTGHPEMYAENTENNMETILTGTDVYEENNQPYISTNNIGHEDDTQQNDQQIEEPLQQYDPNYEQQYLENTYEHQQYDQKQYDENYAEQTYDGSPDGNILEPLNDESNTNAVTEENT